MLITKVSMFSGKENTLDLPITADQLVAWERGDTLIQNAFPHLTADQREFLITGVTAEEWNAMFGSEDVVEDDDNYPAF